MKRYIWKNTTVKQTDDAELRVLRQIVTASDTMLKLGMIDEAEHQRTLADVSFRLYELEERYGMDHYA